MLFTQKAFVKACFILLIVTAGLSATAQVPSQYQADYNKVLKNATAPNPLRFMGSPGNYTNANMKYAWYITLKDGSRVTVYSKIHTDDENNNDRKYLLSVNKELEKSDSNRERKIYSDQTLKVIRYDENTNEPIEGIATDSCWLFKVISGKINAYSTLSEQQNIDPRYLQGLQVDKGPIESFDAVKLESIIKDDEKAYKAFKRKNIVLAIKKYNSNN